MQLSRFLSALVALCPALAAQIPISGNVYDGAGGPLLSGNVYHVSGHLIVPASQTLTIQPGAVVKFNGGVCYIYGTLQSNGTAASPVILTSLFDDAAGGDTNGDGNATTPAPGDWGALDFAAGTSASTLAHTTVRYVGRFGYTAITLRSSDITLTDCTISDGTWGGLYLNNSSRPTVSRCTFTRLAGAPAIYSVDLAAVAGFTSNTATANPGGNYLRVDAANLAADCAIQPNNYPGGALVYTPHIVVNVGATLTLGAGVVLKSVGNTVLYVYGTLHSNGTAAGPVILTSVRDDAAGGDTNGDGNATAPAPGDWGGLDFGSGASASTLAHTTARYVGAFGYTAVVLRTAHITLTDCTMSDGTAGGLYLNNSSRPTVTRCTFTRLSGNPAIYSADLAAVSGFTDNTATANPGGNYLRVDAANLTADCAIQTNNYPGGALVYAPHIIVNTGTTLTLGAGVVLKSTGNTLLYAYGTLQVAGGVVFTSARDDVYGGDTNGDGPSSGTPGEWGGIQISAGSATVLAGALLRFSGGFGAPGVQCDSSQATVRGTRVEHGSGAGFYLTGAAAAEDLVAYANAGDGFRLPSGAFDVKRATAVNNAGYGMSAATGWTGRVLSSVAFGNNSGGFTGFAAGSVNYSDGSGIAGGTGNLTADPQLVDAANGDLRPLRTSPCVDTGEPADAPNGIDAIGFPRFIDGNLDGAQRVDMGADQFDNVLLGLVGTPHPGNVLNFVMFGSPAINVVVLVLGAAPSSGLPITPFGSLFVDITQPYVVLAWPAPPSVVPVTIPLDIGTPTTVIAQAFGFAGLTGRGNVSNAAPITIR